MEEMRLKTHEEIAELQFQHDTKLLHDQITKLPRGDPGRALLVADWERMHVERYGMKPSMSGGGILWRTDAKGNCTEVQRTLATSAGMAVKFNDPPKEQKK